MIRAVGLRNIAVTAVAAAALSAGLSSTASAGAVGPINTGNYSGPVLIQYNGYTTENESANYTTPGTLDGIETTWGAGFMTSMFELGNSGNLFYSNATGNPIGYMLYGLADQQIEPAGMGGVNISNIGCTGGDCDGAIHIDFYELPNGSNTNFGTTLGIDNRTGFGDFMGITDIGTLLMSWEFIPGIVGDPDTVLFQNVTSATLPASGSGRGYAECVAGPACALFQSGNLPVPQADFFIQFTLEEIMGSPQAANGWQGLTSDPVTAYVVPEPAVLAMSGLGFLALGIAVRRRKTH